MAEYIDKEQLLSELYSKQDDENLDMMLEIANFPAADVAQVVHGKWAPSERNPSFLVCSVCGDCYVYDEWVYERKWRYCPNCGAKMDGKGEDA